MHINSLNPNCLNEIFAHLVEDVRTLHSYILVNRHWCNFVIPLLWRYPFELTKLLRTFKESGIIYKYHLVGESESKF